MRLLAAILLTVLLAGCGLPPNLPAKAVPTSSPPADDATPAPTPNLPATVTAPSAVTATMTAPTEPAATVRPSSTPMVTRVATFVPVQLTAMPTPAAPMPNFQPVTQTLGPIPGARSGEQYTVEVTLTNAWYWPGDQYYRPEPGTAFLIVNVELRNLGPASIRSPSSFDFVALDDDRAVRQFRLLSVTRDCRLELAELLPGGRVRSCFGYQVLERGPIEFIFAPATLRAEGLKPGRYLSFPLPAART